MKSTDQELFLRVVVYLRAIQAPEELYRDLQDQPWALYTLADRLPGWGGADWSATRSARFDDEAFQRYQDIVSGRES